MRVSVTARLTGGWVPATGMAGRYRQTGVCCRRGGGTGARAGVEHGEEDGLTSRRTDGWRECSRAYGLIAAARDGSGTGAGGACGLVMAVRGGRHGRSGGEANGQTGSGASGRASEQTFGWAAASGRSVGHVRVAMKE